MTPVFPVLRALPAVKLKLTELPKTVTVSGSASVALKAMGAAAQSFRELALTRWLFAAAAQCNQPYRTDPHLADQPVGAHEEIDGHT